MNELPIYPGIPEKTLLENIHLQVLARHSPKSINFPDTWTPRRQADWFIWLQLFKSKHWSLADIQKKLPVGFAWWIENKCSKVVKSYG